MGVMVPPSLIDLSESLVSKPSELENVRAMHRLRSRMLCCIITIQRIGIHRCSKRRMSNRADISGLTLQIHSHLVVFETLLSDRSWYNMSRRKGLNDSTASNQNYLDVDMFSLRYVRLNVRVHIDQAALLLHAVQGTSRALYCFTAHRHTVMVVARRISAVVFDCISVFDQDANAKQR